MLLVTALVAMAAPEPEAVPRRWQLDFVPGHLRVISIEAPGRSNTVFFYMTYRVTNNSGQDVMFSPSFDLATDDGHLRRSGRDVPPDVASDLLGRLGDPLLQSETDIQGLLLQGPENARHGVVIWPADNLSVDEIDIYAVGLSGETKTVVRPDNGENVVLRKTLRISHHVSGDVNPRSSTPINRTGTRWILR